MSDETAPMRLIFKEAKIVKLTGYPGVDGSTQVLNIRALLTRTLAEQLKCHSLCFNENNMPRRFDILKLTEKIENVEVVFDVGTWLANSATKFKIGHPKEASQTDPSLEIQANLHFDAHVPLWEFLVNQNKAAFEVALKPPSNWNAQGELVFDGPGEEGTGEDEDGEEEPRQADADGDCAHCDAGMKLMPGTLLHETPDGNVLCTLRRVATSESADTQDGPALAPASIMGGSHQKSTRGRKPRDREAEKLADGTALDDTQPVTDSVQ